METMKDVKMKPDGNLYDKLTTSTLQKFFNKIIQSYYKNNPQGNRLHNEENKPR